MAQTVAPIDLGGWRGLIISIGDRIGFLRRGDEAWFGDVVKTGAALPLDKVVGAYELEIQMAKLLWMADQERARYATPMPPGMSSSDSMARIALTPGLALQRRIRRCMPSASTRIRADRGHQPMGATSAMCVS